MGRSAMQGFVLRWAMNLVDARELAFGSLFSTEGKDPKFRVLIALHAAAKFDKNIRGPFQLVEVDRWGNMKEEMVE